MKHIIILLIISLLLFGCTPPSTPFSAPTATPPPTSTSTLVPTSTPIQKLAIHTLRIEYITTADWSKLYIKYTGEMIAKVRVVKQQGDLTQYSAEKNLLSLNQTLENAEAGQQIGITVDFDIIGKRINKPVSFLLQKGAINDVILRFYTVIDGKAILLQEITRKGLVPENTDFNPFNFSFVLRFIIDKSTLPNASSSLPITYGTPVPQSNTKINTENIKELQEIALYNGDVESIIKTTAENKFLFIRDMRGLLVYDYNTLALTENILLPRDYRLSFQSQDLQVSNTGEWVLIDNRWLLNFYGGKNLGVFDLSDILVHEFQNSGVEISLSPDGSKLAVSEFNCDFNPCWFGFQVIATKDKSILYHWDRINTYQLHGLHPVLSSDGYLIATVNPIFSADGGPWDGAFVNIWKTMDGSKISSIKVSSPFHGQPGEVVFSKDSLSIGIKSNDRIHIYDVYNGEKLSEVVDFPSNYSTEENSFYIKPYLPAPWKGYSYQNYFQFSDNNILFFGNGTYEREYPFQSCSLPLDAGIANCAIKNNSGIIVGSDHEYYSYQTSDNNVEFRKGLSSNGSKYYSLPWSGYLIRINALDPLHNLIIYNIASDSYHSKLYIRDTEQEETIMEWEGEGVGTNDVVFSEDGSYATFCVTRSLSTALLEDKLYVLDLSQKKVIYSESFTCGGPITMTRDGNQLAINFFYLKNAGDTVFSSKIMVMDTSNAFTKIYFDLDADCWYLSSIAYSNDGSYLVAACINGSIRFINPNDGVEIHRIYAYPGVTDINLSADENMLALSSWTGVVSIWAIPPITFSLPSP